MSTKVVYLHGIGGATPEWRWIDALNDSLSTCGFDELLPEDVIDFDYASLLDKAITGKTDEPPMTIAKGEVDDHWESEFLQHRNALQTWISNAHLRESSWTPPVPQGAGQLGRLIPQVRNYMSSSEVRHAIWNKVIQSISGHKEVVIVGHSLGSVIAVDVVPRLPRNTIVRALITVASPLCWAPLRKHSKPLKGSQSFPFERVRSWVNVFEPRDVVAFRRGIASYYPMALDVDISTGPVPGQNHDVGLYVAHPVVAYAVGSAVWGAGLPAVQGHVPARRTDPCFRYVLLKFAYAQNFSEMIPAEEAERRRELRLLRELKARETAKWASGLGMDPAQVPTENDFLHHATECLKGEVSIDEVIPLAIQLASEPLFPPFSNENDWDETVRLDTLDRLLLRLEPKGRGETNSRETAQICMNALNAARQHMKVRDGAGLWKWMLVAGVGVAAIAATVITFGLAAPPALAGGAAIVAALAAFGPGGMVGGIVTIAAITSAGAVIAGAGAVGGVSAVAQQEQRQAEQMRAQMRAAVAEMVLNTEPEQLRVLLSALIAAVAAQEELDKRESSGKDSGRDEVYRTIQHVQTAVQAAAANAVLIDPKGRWSTTLKAKADIVELALAWFRDDDKEMRRFESELRDSGGRTVRRFAMRANRHTDGDHTFRDGS